MNYVFLQEDMRVVKIFGLMSLNDCFIMQNFPVAI